MKFPSTYIDSCNRSIELFQRNIISSNQQGLHGKIITTGTTVAAFLNKDKKTGIIASDGRVSMGSISAQENFKKIFDCRVGFVGYAGAVSLVQQVAPVFRANLDSICDSRSRLVTASGAARYLFHHYSAANGPSRKGDNEVSVIDMLALFWDNKDGRCHLYELIGLSRLGREYSASIGSGGILAMLDIHKYDRQPADSKEEIVGRLKELISSVGEKDKATNNHLFYGIVDNGQFSEREEVL